MSDEMGTTATVPTESESRLAGTEQVLHEALEGIEYLRSFIADGHVPCSKDFVTRWDEASETIRAAIAKSRRPHAMSQRTEQLKVYFAYLDELRESGKTNMFGAAPYLADEFFIPKQEARAVLSLWTKTFNGTDTLRARATAAAAFEGRTP